jgi:iron only hydrogenase large subunit-like protein
MIEGVKLIDCKLTPQEWELVKIIRAEDIDFGRITFNLYYQRGKIIRIEREKVIESKMIKA